MGSLVLGQKRWVNSFAPKADLGDMGGWVWRGLRVLTALSHFLVTSAGARTVTEPVLC